MKRQFMKGFMTNTESFVGHQCKQLVKHYYLSIA